eukprot:gene45812-61496_t
MQDGVLRDGSTFEGMGHNNGLEAQMLLTFAKHGSLLFASQTYRRHISRFYLALTEPWGWRGTDYFTRAGSFTWDETNGGVGRDSKHADVAVAKFIFPSDATIDFVYRTEMANFSRIMNFNHFSNDEWGVTEYLYRAVFASDWNEPE